MQIISHPYRAASSLWSQVELGDSRRKRTLIALTSGLIGKPRGRISQAFSAAKDRERAYRFVENPRVRPQALLRALGLACRHAAARTPTTYMILDGSSLHLADPHNTKDFGQVGAHCKGARGLKVITAYGVDAKGTPIGIGGQKYWARQKRRRRGRKSLDNKRRRVSEKETQHWLDVISSVQEHLAAQRLWFIIDREGDSQDILVKLLSTKKRFTVRSSHDRLLACTASGERRYLRTEMAEAPRRGTFIVDVPGGEKRQARKARMVVRARCMQIHLRNRWWKTSTVVTLAVVHAKEEGTVPAGETPLDWMLLTNQPISTRRDVLAVVNSYRMRWRIEDFHKAWKSGHCNVEDMQLHSTHSATIFAIMHAAIAARIERLKHLARTTPEAKARTEISRDEHRALRAIVDAEFNRAPARGGRRQKTYVVPAYAQLTIHEAVDWLARLGGYTGKSSGGPPGTSTIGRGLELLTHTTQVIAAIGMAGRSDQ